MHGSFLLIIDKARAGRLQGARATASPAPGRPQAYSHHLKAPRQGDRKPIRTILSGPAPGRPQGIAPVFQEFPVILVI
ncbi:MAG: hypothetical protein E6I79_15600 [Chloroflexi bacterium]|nr:MAG: hypothetical protein E6I79_15600 [Chloroflexota bacterium]